ncbi:MAG: hypothetical protein H7Y07_15130 [Pyrinomonadaceae bacterium]|nr:hypothetical protein [Sphingobacteriaceae bacterium]
MIYCRTIRIFSFFIALLYLASCSARNVPRDKSISYILPSGIKRIAKTELDENTRAYSAADDFYFYYGVFLAINFDPRSRFEKMTLERHLDNLKYDLKNTVEIELLEIRTVRKKRFIVMGYYDQGSQLNVYKFFNDHERHNIVVDGAIQYDKATQQKEADRLLKIILTSLEMK